MSHVMLWLSYQEPTVTYETSNGSVTLTQGGNFVAIMKHWWFCCHRTDFFHIRRLTTSSCSKKQVTQRLKTLHARQCEATHLQTIAVGPCTVMEFVQSFHQRVHLVFDGSQVTETTSRFLEAFSKFCFKSLRFWKFDVTFCVWRQATNFTFFKVNFCIITNRLHVIDPLLVGCKQTNFVLLP